MANADKTRKSNIWTIMRKELKRFFGDRRMVMTMVLPGILIFVLYSLMGSVMTESFIGDADTVSTIYAENLPESVAVVLRAGGLPLAPVEKPDDPNAAVQNQELDLYAVFPEDFDAAVAAYTPASGAPAPEVKLYYNTASASSSNAFGIMAGLLDSYESAMANKFDVNRTADTYDLATAEDTTGMLLSMLMPMLLISLLFSGCMAVAPESIAGEKERGTLATLLVTPLRRSELAIGKIGALSIVAMCSGLCSFLGVMLSLPKLMGSEVTGMDTGIYGVPEYVSLLVVILSTILVIVSLISVLSALANSVKEASGMVAPLMVVVMLLSLTSSFLPELPGNVAFLIPLYNSVCCISGIFALDVAPVQILLTAVVNLVLTGVLVFVLTRMFNSEKIMFKK
ncbi:MAG: ABC transporter permease [Clostridia bacterium]|nr:ABC transporter permease [Clostridia bacterium]